MVSKVEKVVEIPQVQYVDKVVPIPVQKQARTLRGISKILAALSSPLGIPWHPLSCQVNVPMITQVEKIVEIPQVEQLGVVQLVFP